jgi:hypothetical protein
MVAQSSTPMGASVLKGDGINPSRIVPGQAQQGKGQDSIQWLIVV